MLKFLRGVLLNAVVFVGLGLQMAQAQDVDPARWGVYARLAGAERQAGADGYRLRWRWVRPNEELAEDYVNPRSGQVSSTNFITPGEQPGTLIVTGSFGPVTKIWDGKVLSDGSVDFIARGLRKIPYRASLLEDGTYEMRGLNLDNGVVSSVKPVNERDRYAIVTTTSISAIVAAAPSATADKPVTSSAVPTAPTSPVTAPARDFGFLERYIGRLLVSDRNTLEIYREGNGLALHIGDAGGSRLRRFVVTLDTATGAYALSETTFPTPLKDRLAYFDASGDLYLEYIDENYRYLTRFSPADDSVVFQTRVAERKRFGRYGAFDDWSLSRFAPATDEGLRVAAIKNAQQKQEEQRREQEARERKRESDEQWQNNMNAFNQGLQNALADATASEQQSRAALDVTLQQAAEHAAQREQQQANVRAADDARRAREATERQYEIARQFEAQQQAQRLAQSQAQQEAQRVAAWRPAAQPARPSSATDGNNSSAPSCPKVYKSGTGSSGFADTQADAERWARRDMELQCPMARYTAGAMQCSQKNQGDIVNVDSKGHSTKVGERLAWMCQAEYRCSEPSDQCAKGPARGSAQ